MLFIHAIDHSSTESTYSTSPKCQDPCESLKEDDKDSSCPLGTPAGKGGAMKQMVPSHGLGPASPPSLLAPPPSSSPSPPFLGRSCRGSCPEILPLP